MKIKLTLLYSLTIFILTACSQAAVPLTNRAAVEPTVMAEAQVPSPPDTAIESSPPDAAVETQEANGPAAAIPANTIPAPSCSGELTPVQQEGPYYSTGAPASDNLVEAGLAGVEILLYGWVLDRDCSPIPGAQVELWQADTDGVYDNEGYTLRGFVRTDENGYYEMVTIQPGLYPGRPPHIHAKIFAADGRELLTTQLYFPGSEDSNEVRTFPGLLVTYQDADTDGLIPVLFSFIVKN